VPGGGPGEIKAFGEQTIGIRAVCEAHTIRPVNQGASGTTGSESNSGQSGSRGRRHPAG